MKQTVILLNEMDRRRNTVWQDAFPEIRTMEADIISMESVELTSFALRALPAKLLNSLLSSFKYCLIIATDSSSHRCD